MKLRKKKFTIEIEAHEGMDYLRKLILIAVHEEKKICGTDSITGQWTEAPNDENGNYHHKIHTETCEVIRYAKRHLREHYEYDDQGSITNDVFYERINKAVRFTEEDISDDNVTDLTVHSKFAKYK